MPIHVQAPDGIIEFPDSMQDTDIEKAMGHLYPSGGGPIPGASVSPVPREIDPKIAPDTELGTDAPSRFLMHGVNELAGAVPRMANGEKAGGAADAIEGLGHLAAPFALPAAVAAPVATGVGLVAGTGAQMLGKDIAEGQGASPDTARLIGDVAGIGAGAGGSRLTDIGSRTVSSMRPDVRKALINMIPLYGPKINALTDALRTSDAQPWIPNQPIKMVNSPKYPGPSPINESTLRTAPPPTQPLTRFMAPGEHPPVEPWTPNEPLKMVNMPNYPGPSEEAQGNPSSGTYTPARLGGTRVFQSPSEFLEKQNAPVPERPVTPWKTNTPGRLPNTPRYPGPAPGVMTGDTGTSGNQATLGTRAEMMRQQRLRADVDRFTPPPVEKEVIQSPLKSPEEQLLEQSIEQRKSAQPTKETAPKRTALLPNEKIRRR